MPLHVLPHTVELLTAVSFLVCMNAVLHGDKSASAMVLT